MKYVCQACGFVYDEELGDPDNGIAPGTKFEDLPSDRKYENLEASSQKMKSPIQNGKENANDNYS